MYCPNCGCQINDNDRFCMNCGSQTTLGRLSVQEYNNLVNRTVDEMNKELKNKKIESIVKTITFVLFILICLLVFL